MNVQSIDSPQGPAVAAKTQALQVRGRSFTAVVVRVEGATDKAFFDALEAMMRQAPHFFVNAPLVLDIEKAVGLEAKADFVKVVRQLRARRLTPVGLQGATPDQGAAAFGAGLVMMPTGRDAPLERAGKAAPPAEVAAPVSATVPAPAPRPETPPEPLPAAGLLVTEPVRSGQRICAERGDLVVLAAVSSGAELIAHGNIHVYGPLRGRALAGFNGDRSARIFCQSLEAELVAIAGLYRTSDDLPAAVRGQRVQAFLEDDALQIEPLK